MSSNGNHKSIYVLSDRLKEQYERIQTLLKNTYPYIKDIWTGGMLHWDGTRIRVSVISGKWKNIEELSLEQLAKIDANEMVTLCIRVIEYSRVLDARMRTNLELISKELEDGFRTSYQKASEQHRTNPSSVGREVEHGIWALRSEAREEKVPGCKDTACSP